MLTSDQLDDKYMETSKTYSYPRTIDNFIRALNILKTLSRTGRDTHLLQGEHDTIYVFGHPPISDEQQIELDRLGFRFNKQESWEYNT